HPLTIFVCIPARRADDGRHGRRLLPSFPSRGRTPIGTYTQNYYHMVFSTKHRLELITPDLEERLHPFMGGILGDLGCTPIVVNGTLDTVHLLPRSRSDFSRSDMLRHVKSRSSKWVHETFPELRVFAWQEGYGGFTVSKSVKPAVEAYIW